MTKEEAIRRIKAWNLDSDDMEVLSAVIPELKESEDERIREIIRLALIASEDELSDFYKVHNIRRKECTDWLEKQKEPIDPFDTKLFQDGVKEGRRLEREEIEKEQKPLLPKDKVKHPLYVEGFEAGKEVGRQCEKVFEKQKEQKQYDIDVLERHITKDSVSELAHTVIVRNGWEIVEAKEQKPIKAYDNMDDLIADAMIDEIGKSDIPDSAKHNRIYWINKHRQKPAEWSEVDKNRLEEAIDMVEANGCWVRSDDAVKQVSDFLKSLPERFNLQPKSEWNEEDDMLMDELESYILYDKELNDEQKSWRIKRLKSLRPQPKQELSIEKAIQWFEDTFFFQNNSSGRGEDYEITTHDFDSLEEMYNSFRKAVSADSQSHWKPSEEQLNYVNWAYSIAVAENDTKAIEVLGELHNTLLNLM